MNRLKQKDKVVGTKQTIKAIEGQKALVVYIAKDAELKVTEPVKQLAEKQGIPVVVADTMKQLGEACGVEVKTATAAIVK